MMPIADSQQPRTVQLTTQIDLKVPSMDEAFVMRFSANIARIIYCVATKYIPHGGTAVQLGVHNQNSNYAPYLQREHT